MTARPGWVLSLDGPIDSYRDATNRERNVSKGAPFAMGFLEATRLVTEQELRDNDITRYHVTPFYRDQIRKSGYYDQLKYIVEPSLNEFTSPGSLDTSGEHDNTVV